jgi:phytoene desaturase
MYAVIESLTKIAEAQGVQFHYNTQVEKINLFENRATGVTSSDGHSFQADLVVANADLPYVYKSLLPDDGTATRLERKRFSCSAMIFCWGVDKQYSRLKTHNLFLAGDYRLSFNQIFHEHTMPDDPSFYIHAPTRVDPSMAPEGHDALTIMVPVGHLDNANPQDWDTIQNRARQVIFQRLRKVGIDDIKEHIKLELSYTPLDWMEKEHLVHGATHGLSHDLLQMAYLRPSNRHARYRNLYFVGASTHPGTGMPTVLISARLVTERILQDFEVTQENPVQKPAFIQ